MSANTYRGHWWLPGLPAHVAPGQLVVDQSGRCTLELVGSLDLRAAAALEHPDDSEAKAIRQERVHSILGQVRGQPITLLNCFAGNADGVSHRGRSRLDISVQGALVGAHVEHDEPAFRSAIVEIENLTAWLGVDDQVHRRSDDNGETVALTRLEDLKAEIDGWTITTRRTVQPFSSHLEHAKASVSSHIACYLVLRPPEPRPAHDFHSVILELMDLLTLASGRPCGQIKLTLIHRDNQVLPERHGSNVEFETRVDP
ncbi:hypothetical protein JF550_02810 [Microbacterium esteraromaticum]|uniref:ApeA N-terminal domain-containing protein n=1 Tax=Microbacterium esteraromaticum TaxID=57043 RepID=A0A939DU05_9MICO|nr:hypothetical protein [Microbacterium esteraromaticum]MBN8204885.1 hypothetical protein [Microbacterium esteraromaticum]MBN8415039.1 hypothetical protein [Microbacterium esteraromaticum]